MRSSVLSDCRQRHPAEEHLAARAAAERGRPTAVVMPGDGSAALQTTGRRVGAAFRALRVPQFRWFWTGALAASSGIWMLNVTIPYLLFAATGLAGWAGVGAAAQFVPAMAAAAAGGVLADRYPRRRILLLTQAAILTIAVGLATAQLAGAATVPVLLTAAALAGTANGLQTPPWQALVPELVPRGQVLNAVALNAMQANAARAVGPAVAGVLLAAWGPASAFAATAVANLVMLAALARINGLRRPAPATAESALRRLAAGIAYTRRHTGLWLAVCVTAAVSFVGTPIVQLAPVLAEDVFAVGAVGYGLLVSGLGLGTVLGAIVLSAYGAGQCRSSIVTVAIAAHAMAAIAVAVAPRFWFALTAVLLLGASYVAVLSTANATIQVVAAEPYRGRAASQYWMAFAGAYPVGALVQGWLTDLVGVRAAVGAAGAALLIALVVVRARPALLDTLDSHSHQAQQPASADIGR